MSKTESTMVQLGTPAAEFALRDVVSGAWVTRESVMARPGGAAGSARRAGLLVMFVCPHCPYVKHIEMELGALGRDYCGADGTGPIAMVAIQSNDLETYPQDGPAAMREQAAQMGWGFPYLLDETQAVARAYQAACTPDFFLFDRELRLAYRGQLDGSRPRRGEFGNDEPVTGRDLRAAMDALVAGRTPEAEQRNSIGCNIKWRADDGGASSNRAEASGAGGPVAA